MRFAILLPITLPKAMPDEPRSAACRVTTSSGIEVAEGHDCGPDQQRRDVQPLGERDRAPHQRLSAREEQDETAD